VPFAVTLNLYSQRPDPRWALSPEQDAEFLDRVRSLLLRTPLKARGVAGRTGYRGFTVSSSPDSPLAGPRVLVLDGIVDPGVSAPSFFDPERGLEKWLLSTAGEALAGDVRAAVASLLERPADEAVFSFAGALALTARAGSCVPRAADAPAFVPGLWTNGDIQDNNHCYDYANNQQTGTQAVPGTTHGIQVVFTCPSIQAAAEADGLVQTPDFTRKLRSGEGWYVALALSTTGRFGPDFHWYRQDDDGCWSHKVGGDPPTNCDDSFNAITNPKHCDRGEYDTFCCFMITNGNVKIS
jgi:hypothetical protein